MHENKYTLDEIIHLTGIPQAKAIEACNILCSENYLVYDQSTGKYSFTKDKDKRQLFQQVKEDMTNDQTAGEMYAKIENIMTFGKPLALSNLHPDSAIKDTGVPGLNVIFGNYPPSGDNFISGTKSSGKATGLPRGHCVLIKGEPGTGKTTLGMQIAVHFHDQRALFLTFEEDVDQLCKNLDIYFKKDESSKIGWEKAKIKKVTRTIMKINTPMIWEDPEAVLQELIAILDKEIPQMVVIDSITRLRDIGGESKCRLVLRRLIRTLKLRHITSIFLGEDDGDRNAFEDYEVDGIIRLSWIKEQLSLTINKMRGMKTYKGPHSAAMLTVDDIKDNDEHFVISEEDNPGAFYLRPGFNVFPEISLYKELTGKKKIETTALLSTGISGLDDLLQIDEPEGKGFKPGEIILINGSAGAGKTLIALAFMNNGFPKEGENRQPKKKVGVWFSFEGDKDTLYKAVQGFKKSPDNKSFYQDLLSSIEEKDSEKEFFKFFNFPPLNLDLNKIIYTIESLLGKYIINRLVIDSITELERAKGGGQPEVKTFLAGLIQYLRDRKITTIFISRTNTFFKSIDKVEEQVSSLVDMIICIRNFDMRNQIHRGIYIQKARGRKHNSKIMRMTIEPEKGVDVEDRGWDVQNLLAGDTSNIQGPKVFFKLFYENPAEKDINEAIIEDFDQKRYPGDDGPTFGAVRKRSIYTEFWSFQGQYSSGHANTRLLSIPDYIINAFRDKNRLEEIDKYVKTDVIKKLENEKTLISRYAPKKSEKQSNKIKDESELSKKKIDAVPSYLDYGVMVYREKEGINLFENNFTIGDLLGENQKKEIRDQYTWENLLEKIHTNNGQQGDKEFIPFAFPPLDKKSEFVAFFLELLWSYGGDIFDTDISLRKENQQDQDIMKAFGEKLKISILNEVKKICDLEDTGNISKKFSSYGITNRFENVEQFLEWILKESKNISNNSDVKVRLDDEPFKETIKLMLRLVYKAKVKNPIHGEYRHRAVFSRVWYSQVKQIRKEQCYLNSCPFEQTDECQWLKKKNDNQMVNKEDYQKPITKAECFEKKFIESQKAYRLLPLPLAAIPGTGKKENNEDPMYRSITCQTYWSLVMLKDALSPEIGGNFIESMNSPEYFERRLKEKTGMPVTYLEINKEKYMRFDPDSYGILGQTFENDKKRIDFVKSYITNNDELDKILKEISETKIEGPILHDIAIINDYEFQGMIRFKINELKKKGNRTDQENREIEELEKEINEVEKKLKGKLNNRVFFSRVRQSRTAFYLLEEALHYQLTQLFIEQQHLRDKNLYGERFIEDEIIERIDNLDDTLEKISHQFRTHVIFELLVYFYINRDKK